MRFRFVSSLNAFLHVGDASTPAGCALLEERYRALERQVPLLYIIALANMLGLALSGSQGLEGLLRPGALMAMVIVVRLVYWARQRHRDLTPDQIIDKFRQSLVLVAIFSLLFGWSAIDLFDEGDSEQASQIVLFSSLAMLGCAYGLSPFPSAARLPLLLIGLPLAIRLVVSPNPAHIGVGVSLVLIIFLILRLLRIQSDSFAQLVESRTQIATERERARRAERAAVAEKAKVRAIADTDPLTGVGNRRSFIEMLERHMATDRTSTSTIALIDLDGFKPINDTFGHAAGDAVLAAVARRLTRTAGRTAFVARMGGDEFALLMPDQDGAAAEALGQSLCAALRRPYRVEGRRFKLSGSCGLALIEPDDSDFRKLLIRCDTALYTAKQRGRDSVAFFSPAMADSSRRRLTIEGAFRADDVHDQIQLVYQPIYELATGDLRSFEALARWSHSELGAVSPAEFIPIIEQINVIEEISDALLRRAAAEAAKWPETVSLSFNLSAVQLCSDLAGDSILGILDAQGLAPSRLQIEVTETALLADFEVARQNLKALSGAGARIVLDDFGAGYASLSYLREMNFDAIKLDGSLVTAATGSEAAAQLLRGVLGLCSSLGLPCIAEHIETAAQRDFLQALGCAFGQGFALAEPMDADKACAMARSTLVSIASGQLRRRYAAR